MTRKSISFTDTHDEWLKAQIASGQYTSESEVIRDLIRERQKRDDQVEAIRNELIKAEQSGFTDLTLEDIREEARKTLRRDGHL